MTTVIHTRDVGESASGYMGWDETVIIPGYGSIARDTTVKRLGTGSVKFTMVGNAGGGDSAGYARGFLDGGSYPSLGGGPHHLGEPAYWGMGATVCVAGWYYLYPGFYANSGERQLQLFRVANTNSTAAPVIGTQLGLVINSTANDPTRKLRMCTNIYPDDGGSSALQEYLFTASQDFSAHGATGGPGKLAEGRWYHLECKYKFHPTNGQAISQLWVDGISQGYATNRNIGRTDTVMTRVRFGVVDGGGTATGFSIGIDGPITVSDTPLGMVPLTATAPTGTVTPPFIFSGAQLGQGWEDVQIVKFWIDPPAYQWNEPFPEFSMTGLNRPPHWPPYTGCKYAGQKYVADDGVSLVGINQPIALTAGAHIALAQGWTEVNEGGVSLTRFMGQDTISFTVP